MGFFNRKPKKEAENTESVKETPEEVPVSMPDADPDMDEADYYREKIDELKKRLYYDNLGCKSKVSFDEDIQKYFAGGSFMLVTMTVNLERVNKRLGRDKGDEALKAISEIYYKYFPDFYHIGGEKFNILSGSANELAQAMQNIVRDVAAYLIKNKLDIDIYYGSAGPGDGKTISEVIGVAVSRMYDDRNNKRPGNENVVKEEMEAKRLEKAIERKETLKKELEEKEREMEKEDAKKEMGEMTSQLSLFFDEVQNLQKEMDKTKGLLVQLKKEEELIDTEYIPGYPFEADGFMETPDKKFFETMWFYQASMDITDDRNEYHKIRILVYPITYEKPPMTIESLVIIEDEYKRHLYSGKNVKAGIANTEFYINSRFVVNDKGTAEFRVAINKRTDNYIVVKGTRKERVHEGVCTPYHFGKLFFDKELYPIRGNINGLVDCVVREKDGTLSENDGTLKHNDRMYQFVKNGNTFELVRIV